tara:strand:- start:2054 stop:2644 length:591 start_codon:yes stop_codon:yes gene_type:complete
MATLANKGEANQMAFGQHGCVFIDDDDHIFIPPDGKVVVSIQCLGDTAFDLLVAEDPNRFFNTASAAHAVANDTVSTGVTNGTFIDMDGTVTASVGDSMYLASTGAFIAKVKAVGTDSSGSADDSAIELDRLCTVTAAAHAFTNADQGSGGHTVATANIFPKGMTIYGRWTVVSLSADQNLDGAILYLGPGNYHPE